MVKCEGELMGPRVESGLYYPLFLGSGNEPLGVLAIRCEPSGGNVILVNGEVTEDGERIKQALLDWAKQDPGCSL